MTSVVVHTQPQIVCEVCEKRHNGKCRFENLFCFSCNKTGHDRRQCTAGRRDEKKNEKTTKKKNSNKKSVTLNTSNNFKPKSKVAEGKEENENGSENENEDAPQEVQSE
jgi:hypothetical protein